MANKAEHSLCKGNEMEGEMEEEREGGRRKKGWQERKGTDRKGARDWGGKEIKGEVRDEMIAHGSECGKDSER